MVLPIRIKYSLDVAVLDLKRERLAFARQGSEYALEGERDRGNAHEHVGLLGIAKVSQARSHCGPGVVRRGGTAQEDLRVIRRVEVPVHQIDSANRQRDGQDRCKNRLSGYDLLRHRALIADR
jgi:hypothetical protein